MKGSLALAVFVVVAGGCAAHAPRPEPRWFETAHDDAGRPAITVRHTAQDEAAALQVQRALRVALPVAQRWGELPAHLTITIHPTHEGLEAAARRPGVPWLRAWARRSRIDLQSPRTWSRGAATDGEVEQLLAHELTHCALDRALGGDAHVKRQVPAWFWEGMATTTASERFTHGALPITDGTLAVTDPLHDPGSPAVYPASDHAFRDLTRRYGDERIRRLLATVRDGAEFATAFQAVFGVELQAFERESMRSYVAARSRG